MITPDSDSSRQHSAPCRGCHRSGNGQGTNSSRSGKSRGISLRVRVNLILWEKSEKSEILRVLIYLLPTQRCFCVNKNASCQLMLTARILWGRLKAITRINYWIFLNLVGQGNFTFVREKSKKSQRISKSYGCGNHACAMQTRTQQWRHLYAHSRSKLVSAVYLLRLDVNGHHICTSKRESWQDRFGHCSPEWGKHLRSSDVQAISPLICSLRCVACAAAFTL